MPPCRECDLPRPHAQCEVGERVLRIGEGEVVEACLAPIAPFPSASTAKRAMSAAALVTLTAVVKVPT